MKIHTRVTGRPTRLAFLVDKVSHDSVVAAIRAASIHWGGNAFPIIAMDESFPDDGHALHREQPEQTATRLIDAFDPDVLVDCGVQLLPEWSTTRTTVKLDKLFQTPLTPRYGASIVNCLRHLWDTELKYVHKHERRLLLPKDTDKHPILAALFGALPKDSEDSLRPLLPTDTEAPVVTLQNAHEWLGPEWIHPLRMTITALERDWSQGGAGEPAVFVLDPSSVYDVVDFWNLRAAGWRLFPITAGVEGGPGLDGVLDFLERWHPARQTGTIRKEPTVLKARCVRTADFEAFLERLGPPVDTIAGEFRWAAQRWLPRLSALGNESRPVPYRYGEHSSECDSSGPSLEIEVLPPPIPLDRGQWEYSYANDIDFRSYGERVVANVFPEGTGPVPAMCFEHITATARLGQRGLTVFPGVLRVGTMLGRPDPQRAVSAYLRQRGFSTELSSAGRVAKSMLQKLDGGHGLSLIAHPGVIDLLRRASNGRSLGAAEVLGRLQTIAKELRFHNPHMYVRRLVEANALRLGYSVQCPHCQQRTWFALNELDYSLKCGSCLESFSAPTHSPPLFSAAYRAFGPFASDQGSGAYTVLLTLRFFLGLRGCYSSPALSMNLKGADTIGEVDLALLCRRRDMSYSPLHLVLCECKTRNSIESADFQRLRTLRSLFPNSLLVLAILRDSFSAEEQAEIRALIDLSPRVLLLTARELFAGREAPDLWDGLPEAWQYVQADPHEHDFNSLCKLTHAIYL